LDQSNRGYSDLLEAGYYNPQDTPPDYPPSPGLAATVGVEELPDERLDSLHCIPLDPPPSSPQPPALPASPESSLLDPLPTYYDMSTSVSAMEEAEPAHSSYPYFNSSPGSGGSLGSSSSASAYSSLAARSGYDYSSLYSQYYGSNYPYSMATGFPGGAGGGFPSKGSDYPGGAASSYFNTYASYYSQTGAPYSAYMSGSGSPATSSAPTIYQLSSIPPPAALTDPPGTLDSDILKPPGRKGSATSRGRIKRRNSGSPDLETQVDRVFIWDLDETIILFHSLLTGTFATKYVKDGQHLHMLGQKMEDLIFTVADTNFFFNDLEDCDQVHIDDVGSDDNGQDLSNYNFQADGFRSSGASPEVYMATAGMRGGVDWMRKLAFRFRKIKENYNTYRNNVGGLLGANKREEWVTLTSDLETSTDQWLNLALKCLQLIQGRPDCVNVIVTQTQLVAALTKILLFGLGPLFPVENVYSATKIGKEACFERIMSKFGRKSTYVVVGDGKDEEVAAKTMNFPFWRISAHSDLIAFYNALDMGFM